MYREQPPYNPNVFGANVRKELKRQKKNISWLSKQTGISQCMMSYYLSGKTDPPLTKALKIAETLKAPLSFLSEENYLGSQSLLCMILHDTAVQRAYLNTVPAMVLIQEINKRNNTQ